MRSMIIEAAEFAMLAHAGQKRKWCDEPYIWHPMRVAGRVTMLAVCDEQIAAAWLHDVVEDCGKTHNEIRERFGLKVEYLVLSLTNPSRQHPHLPRAERKAMDRDHIAGQSAQAKEIKLIDRIDNLRSLSGAPADSVKLYVEESRLLANAIGDYSGGVLYRELIALCDKLDLPQDAAGGRR